MFVKVCTKDVVVHNESKVPWVMGSQLHDNGEYEEYQLRRREANASRSKVNRLIIPQYNFPRTFEYKILRRRNPIRLLQRNYMLDH